MSRFPIYGGPSDGFETDAAHGEYWTYRNDTLPPFVAPDAPAPEMPRFHYVRVMTEGGPAFVPAADKDLIAAYRATDGIGAAAEALAAEIDRRNLDL